MLKEPDNVNNGGVIYPQSELMLLVWLVGLEGIQPPAIPAW